MRIIKTLEELIRIDSCNPFCCHQIDPQKTETWKLEGHETALAVYLECKLRRAGFRVSRQRVHTDPKGRSFYNLLAEKGVGDRSLLFYGHMDTVTAKPWLSKQIALRPRRRKRIIKGKRVETLVGLGANDMKAGLAVLISAFDTFEPQGYKLKVACGVDEEYYSLGANVLAHSPFMNDVRAVIVPEIADGPNGAQGPRTIALGRLGRCEFLLTVPGTGGHGAQAGQTAHVNAALECAKIVKRLEAFGRSFQDEFIFAPGQTRFPGRIKGSLYVNRLEAGDGTLSIPVAGVISVSVSFTPNIKINRLLKMLQQLIKEMYAKGELKKTVVSGRFRPVQVTLRPRPTPHSEAYCLPPNHPFAVFVKQKIATVGGFRGFNMGYSVADENVFQRIRPKIPVLAVGPLGELCHRADEWVGVRSVEELQEVFQAIARDFSNYLQTPGLRTAKNLRSARRA